MSSPASEPSIAVFHDESGDFGHDDWVCIGLLWVPRDLVPELAAALAVSRADYRGEVHFYRFPRNFAGEYGGAARVARTWFELWRDVWGQRVAFNVLAVNRRHLLYDQQRFGRPDHAYNHFTAEALRAGVAAFYREQPSVALAIWSDARSGEPPATGPQDSKMAPDAFATALCQAFAPDPPTTFVPSRVALTPRDIHALSGMRAGAKFTPEQELLQLTDLLLGAAATAIAPRTTSATKRWFARAMGHALREVRTAPLLGSHSLHGHLLATYFPGHDGRLAADGPIGIWDEQV